MNSQEDWFMLSNQKEPWTKSEVEKVLGDNLLEREQGKHVIKCVLSPDHENQNRNRRKLR